MNDSKHVEKILRDVLDAGWKYQFNVWSHLLIFAILMQFLFFFSIEGSNGHRIPATVEGFISNQTLQGWESVRYFPQWGKADKYFHICRAAVDRGCQTSFMSFETYFQKRDIKYQDRHKAVWDKQRENKLQAAPAPSVWHLHSLHFHPEKGNNLRAQTARKPPGAVPCCITTIRHFCS